MYGQLELYFTNYYMEKDHLGMACHKKQYLMIMSF